MPKSAIDATRFTPTTPHVSAKHPSFPSPAAASGSLLRRTPGPPGETPQQRVKRLREAANRARDAQVSGFDKVIVRGRVWADRAHRFTALGLIGITAIAGAVTVYALGDMMIYNRRKRHEYFAQQAAMHALAVHEAQTALRQGTASDEQRELLESEDAERRRREAEMEAKSGKGVGSGGGVWAQGKNWLFSGLKREQGGGEAASGDDANAVMQDEEETLPSSYSSAPEERMRLAALGIGSAPGEENEGLGGMGRESAVMKAVGEKKAQVVEKAERERARARARGQEGEKSGGILDRLGTVSDSGSEEMSSSAHGGRTVEAGAGAGGGGWFGFMRRR